MRRELGWEMAEGCDVQKWMVLPRKAIERSGIRSRIGVIEDNWQFSIAEVVAFAFPYFSLYLCS
jgi:hypothetical protein